MATAETVDLGPPHAPKEESVAAFKDIEHDLKKRIVQSRHEANKHEPQFFEAVEHLSNSQLAGFGPSDFKLVRVAVSAYGIHLFGKVRIPDMPDSGPAYIHFRAFSGGERKEPAKFHSIRMEETGPDGHKTFRAIFSEADPIEWFDA